MKKTAGGKHLKADGSNYDDLKYKNPSVTTDVAICSIFNNEIQIPLIKRKHNPYKNCWALPGGFVDVDKDNTLEEAALRELKEETGLYDVYLEQLKTYGDKDRDPRKRIISIAYFALTQKIGIDANIRAGDDAKEVKWFSLRKIPPTAKLTQVIKDTQNYMAFDHKQILKDLFNRLKGKILYTPIAFELLPKRFTWAQLQHVYEVILRRKLKAPNFRSKMNDMYTFKELKTKKYGKQKGRPPIYLKYEGEKDFS